MEQYKRVLETVAELKHDEKLIESYRCSFETIIKAVEPEDVYRSLQELPNDLFVLSPLFVGSLFVRHRFQEIHDFLRDIDLYGSDRHLDVFNGKLLKYYYLSMKYLNTGIDVLYKLMITNREYGNEYSIGVLTNCILDFQINNGIYQEIKAEILDNEENARYSFYLGIISLVKGGYMDALDHFNRSDILNKNRKLELRIKKYTIVCKLLLSDYCIFYPYLDELKPYFSLIGAVRRAELDVFYRLFETHREEFFSLNIYFIVRRLLGNLLQEGLRKISVCYSRISIEDISRILGVNVDYLIHNAIKNKFIKGYVEGGVYHSSSCDGKKIHLGERIREVVGVRNTIAGMMNYPEIAPLTYELIMESEANANN